jgi:hypothetical protein
MRNKAVGRDLRGSDDLQIVPTYVLNARPMTRVIARRFPAPAT